MLDGRLFLARNFLTLTLYQGYPEPDKERKAKAAEHARDVVKGKDVARAYEKVPRGHYKGEESTLL